MADSVGDRLRAARERRGLTTREAAKLAGTSNSAWVKAETGERMPTLNKLYEWALVLGVSPRSIDPRLADVRPRKKNRGVGLDTRDDPV